MSDPFPPPNPSIRWFRLVVWLMPTCVAFTTFIAVDVLASFIGLPAGIWLFGWGMINLAATYGLGLFDGRLRRSEQPSADIVPPEVRFLVHQVMIVPCLFLASWLVIRSIL